MEFLELANVPCSCIELDDTRANVRLVKNDFVFRIEIKVKRTTHSIDKSFLNRLRLLFRRKIKMYTEVTWIWLPIRAFYDDDPDDPYVENCAREAFDYLTKEI